MSQQDKVALVTGSGFGEGIARRFVAGRAMVAPFGIRVAALNPVAGETPPLDTFMGEDTEEVRKKFRDSIPLGRLLRPEDISEAAAFVASPQASMITGVALDVDGGRSI
jgi:3-oxoacyl-[acyl-carrier protein] reductase